MKLSNFRTRGTDGIRLLNLRIEVHKRVKTHGNNSGQPFEGTLR